MTNTEAQQVVLGVWNRLRNADELFEEACRQLGITPVALKRLGREMRHVVGALPRNVVLTPMTVGRRR